MHKNRIFEFFVEFILLIMNVDILDWKYKTNLSSSHISELNNCRVNSSEISQTIISVSATTAAVVIPLPNSDISPSKLPGPNLPNMTAR